MNTTDRTESTEPSIGTAVAAKINNYIWWELLAKIALIITIIGSLTAGVDFYVSAKLLQFDFDHRNYINRLDSSHQIEMARLDSSHRIELNRIDANHSTLLALISSNLGNVTKDLDEAKKDIDEQRILLLRLPNVDVNH